MLNKHKQQIMTITKKLSVQQVSNPGKYVQPNIANEAQLTGHRTLKYISN